MSNPNRQSLRSKKMMRQALVELLKDNPLQKISISAITDRADVTRSTFYSHFQTKEELLYCCIDDLLSVFFNELRSKDGFGKDELADVRSWAGFFRLWAQNSELLELLKISEIEKVFIERLKTSILEMHKTKITKDIPDMNPVLAAYYRDFLAHSIYSVLHQWVITGMRQPPETMGKLLNELCGPIQARRVTENVKDLIK